MTTSECESGQWRVQRGTAHLFSILLRGLQLNLILSSLGVTDITHSFAYLACNWHIQRSAPSLHLSSPQFVSFSQIFLPQTFSHFIFLFPTIPPSQFPSSNPPSLCLFLCPPLFHPPPVLNATYQMEGDSMQLWVLSSRQHLREKLSPTHMHTDGGRDRH